DDRAVEVRQRPLAREELVTGGPDQVHVAEHLLDHLVERVDGDGPGPRQGEAAAGADPDLEVGSRLQELVQTLQQLVTAQGGGPSCWTAERSALLPRRRYQARARRHAAAPPRPGSVSS